MNVADTDLIGTIFANAGYETSDSAEDASVILLNTCAIREKAEERIFGRLGWLKPIKKSNPNTIIGVTGCMAEHLKAKLLERAPHVDLIVGPDGYRNLPTLVKNARGADDDPHVGLTASRNNTSTNDTSIKDTLKSDSLSDTSTKKGSAKDHKPKKKKNAAQIDVRLNRDELYRDIDKRTIADREAVRQKDARVSGFLTIMRGCDKFCTFCVVPYVRGRERSLEAERIVEEAIAMEAAGYKEITLLGQTVSSYNVDGVNFASLLRQVHDATSVRLRFTSPYPTDFDEELLETMADLPRVGKQLHLPLQSGSTNVLGIMRRRYTADEYKTIIDRVRRIIPDFALSTDIIVGFPGESEADFQETLDMCRHVQFDSAFMFMYSERELTVASRKLPDTVSEEEKSARLQRLLRLQETHSQARSAAKVGTTVDVLVTGTHRKDDTKWVGRSSCFRPTTFAKSPSESSPNTPLSINPGDIVNVQIERAKNHALFGVGTYVHICSHDARTLGGDNQKM